MIGTIGGPTITNISFDRIELYSAHDTIILDSKEKIFKQLITDGKHKKGKGGDYYLEIH
jgi:hypothetical protein